MRNRAITIILPLLAVLLLTPWLAIAADNNEFALAENPDSGNAASTTTNDSYLDRQWALNKIHALDAWQITTGSRDVLIAVLDTGIDQNHADLAGKVVASINLTASQTADDVNGHGTHIAGIIGATANNGTGIAGVANNASLMNVKVADDAGFTDAAAVARGIIWAVNNGAKVINISLTLIEPNQALEEAVDYAWIKGAVVVAAAGNNGGSAPVYPAYYANSLAVTSTNNEDQLAQLAKCGEWVDIAAPGVNIYSTLPGDSYGYKSGTSMAAAYVSGVAGLLFNVVSDRNGNGRLNDEVRNAIENSAVGTPGIAHGRIDALKALYEARD